MFSCLGSNPSVDPCLALTKHGVCLGTLAVHSLFMEQGHVATIVLIQTQAEYNKCSVLLFDHPLFLSRLYKTAFYTARHNTPSQVFCHWNEGASCFFVVVFIVAREIARYIKYRFCANNVLSVFFSFAIRIFPFPNSTAVERHVFLASLKHRRLTATIIDDF